nr:MAG TPA: hypothetical protein [Caudoviricetes sp.]
MIKIYAHSISSQIGCYSPRSRLERESLPIGVASFSEILTNL